MRNTPSTHSTQARWLRRVLWWATPALCLALALMARPLGAPLAFALAGAAGLGLVWLAERLSRHDTTAQAQTLARAYVQRIIDALPAPVYVKNGAGVYVLINAAFCHQRGQPAYEILGKTARELASSPEIASAVTQEDRDILKGARVLREELFHNPITERATHRIVSKALSQDTQGAPVIVGISFDVTDLRLAELGLREALDHQSHLREYLQTVLNALPSPLFVKDAAQRIVRANRAFCELLELDPGQILGQKATELLPDITREHDIREEERLSLDPQTPVLEREGTMFDRQGRLRELIIRKIAARDAEQRRVVVATITDITSLRFVQAELDQHRHHLRELVQAQTADLQHAKSAAEQACAAKTTLFSSLSHELRTPMHAILSFARLGAERAQVSDAEKLQNYFERIRSAGERLLLLLNDILDLAKFEAGKMDLSLQRVRLQHITEEAIREFEASLVSRNVSVAATIADDGVVIGDAMRLGQVVRNLLSNAINFSPPGGVISVSLSATGLQVHTQGEALPSMPAMELRVADQGPGIPPAELEQIFESYSQSSATRPTGIGTGLGLSICREIVLGHGGTIYARNRTEGGAEFIVCIPSPLH